jgi:hypothetical protein
MPVHDFKSLILSYREVFPGRATVEQGPSLEEAISRSWELVTTMLLIYL